MNFPEVIILHFPNLLKEKSNLKKKQKHPVGKIKVIL